MQLLIKNKTRWTGKNAILDESVKKYFKNFFVRNYRTLKPLGVILSKNFIRPKSKFCPYILKGDLKILVEAFYKEKTHIVI